MGEGEVISSAEALWPLVFLRSPEPDQNARIKPGRCDLFRREDGAGMPTPQK